MGEPVLANPLVRVLVILLVVLLACLLAYLLSPVLVPLFLAFLVAYVLDPVVDFFERRRVPRAVTIAALAVLGVVLVVSVPVFAVPSLVAQADDLIQSAARVVRDDDGSTSGALNAWSDRLADWLHLDRLVKELGWVEADDDEFDARAVLMKRIGTYVKTHAQQWLKAYGQDVALAGRDAGITLVQVFASMGRSIVDLLVFLGNLAVFAFVAGYLLKDFDGIVTTAKGLIPPRYRPKTLAVMSKIDAQLRGFLRGQFTVCLCLGVMYAIGLLIAGVPFAILIGAFGTLAAFVPYLGMALTIMPALILVLLQYGIDWHVVMVVGTFAFAQMIEGTVLTPKIVGDQVGLGPVWVILAVLVFGSTLGFLGLLLAVPAAATLKVLVVEAVSYYKASPVFEEGDSDGSGRPGAMS